jgi:hypothetical protein
MSKSSVGSVLPSPSVLNHPDDPVPVRPGHALNILSIGAYIAPIGLR